MGLFDNIVIVTPESRGRWACDDCGAQLKLADAGAPHIRMNWAILMDEWPDGLLPYGKALTRADIEALTPGQRRYVHFTARGAA